MPECFMCLFICENIGTKKNQVKGMKSSHLIQVRRHYLCHESQKQFKKGKICDQWIIYSMKV